MASLRISSQETVTRKVRLGNCKRSSRNRCILGELGVGLWISHINGQLRIKAEQLRSKSDQLLRPSDAC
jgi:hypothetical protein